MSDQWTRSSSSPRLLNDLWATIWFFRQEDNVAAIRSLGASWHPISRKGARNQGEAAPWTMWTIIWACSYSWDIVARRTFIITVIKRIMAVRFRKSVHMFVAFAFSGLSFRNSEFYLFQWKCQVSNVLSSLPLLSTFILRRIAVKL